MIERIYILESVDPVIFYGVNNVNMQLIKTLFPKLRIVARGNVMKVIGDEDESELFLKKIREVEKYCEEFNSLSEDVILDIIKGKAPVITKQENLIIHGMNGKPIVARTENQQRLVKAFEENDLVFATGPAGTGKTFVAIALAVKALKNKEIRKIILSRPAVLHRRFHARRSYKHAMHFRRGSRVRSFQQEIPGTSRLRSPSDRE